MLLGSASAGLVVARKLLSVELLAGAETAFSLLTLALADGLWALCGPTCWSWVAKRLA